MVRLRKMLAHGGIAALAVVFALAFAGFYLADGLAQIAVSVIGQHVEGGDLGFLGYLTFQIAGTAIAYGRVLQFALTMLLLAAALYGVGRLTRSAVRVCPACRSEVPREASVCRYCRAQLSEEPR